MTPVTDGIYTLMVNLLGNNAFTAPAITVTVTIDGTALIGQRHTYGVVAVDGVGNTSAMETAACTAGDCMSMTQVRITNGSKPTEIVTKFMIHRPGLYVQIHYYGPAPSESLPDGSSSDRSTLS